MISREDEATIEASYTPAEIMLDLLSGRVGCDVEDGHVGGLLKVGP